MHIYLFVTSIYYRNLFIWILSSPPSAIYNNKSVIFLLGTTMEISVFTFLCYPGTLMYLCVIICINISVQISLHYCTK